MTKELTDAEFIDKFRHEYGVDDVASGSWLFLKQALDRLEKANKKLDDWILEKNVVYGEGFAAGEKKANSKCEEIKALLNLAEDRNRIANARIRELEEDKEEMNLELKRLYSELGKRITNPGGI